MKLTDHFSLDELTRSDVAVRLGIDNTPGQLARDNLVLLARGLESVRAALGGVPILISSGFRCEALNRATGGSLTSSHRLGLAADFTAPAFGTPTEIARHLAGLANALCFDQLIDEGPGRWVHIGFAVDACTPRQQVLTASFAGGKVTYSSGIA